MYYSELCVNIVREIRNRYKKPLRSRHIVGRFLISPMLRSYAKILTKYLCSGHKSTPDLQVPPLPDNTQHPQVTGNHASGGIRTRNPSKQAAADLRLRRRGHRYYVVLTTVNIKATV
jgi:hypothetical protein